jgi:LmbE family N-acetylglucosaminyl deacetylase
LSNLCIRQAGPPSQCEFANQVLRDLAMGTAIDLPTIIVVAHPDDETLGMGGRLAVLQRSTIVQLTDGAPRETDDARQRGFSNRFSYSAEREREISRALKVLGLRCRRIRHNAPDQESVLCLRELARSVKRDLRGASLVFTHPYEGGHPDHDTAALLVQMACARLSADGEDPPVRFEFASYHHRQGRMITGQFWPDQNCPEISIELDHRTCPLKSSAMAEYRTQADVIAWFGADSERYRIAPWYDFTQAPPPGVAQYDFFGWPMTSSRWRESCASTMPWL